MKKARKQQLPSLLLKSSRNTCPTVLSIHSDPAPVKGPSY